MPDQVDPSALPGGESTSPATPRTPKTSKGRKRHRELVEATMRALNSKGYNGLNIQDITTQADAPVGLFYRYFGNKDEAVLAAVEVAVRNYREQFQTKIGGPFFDHQRDLHKVLLDFFAEWPGVMSCYYSLAQGGRAFSEFFEESTLAFDNLHAGQALQHVEPAMSRDDLLPVVHGLTALSDNFLFRHFTNRDDTAILSRSAGVDIPALLAGLRVRGLVLGKSGRPGEGLDFPTRKKRTKSAARAPSRLQNDDLRDTHALDTPPEERSARHEILKATQSVLNRLSFDDLRLKDIEDLSGATRGGLYHHFDDKRDVVREALGIWLAQAYDRFCLPQQEDSPPGYTALAGITHHLLGHYASKPGLLRAIYDLEDRDLEIARKVKEYRYHIANRIVAAAGLTAKSRRQADLNLMIGYALLSQIDRYAFDVFTIKLEPFATIWKDTSALADFIATLWFRMIFCCEPSEETATQASSFPAGQKSKT
ncbi:MAG: TetR/AcrR family transcriptional regulator [Hyphomonadaceae bacterium]|nr:TetR/AcrR family transcriptional regulator [Hyphomonadaceae bacterium]